MDNIGQEGNIDIRHLVNDPKMWDSENEQFTELGQSAYQDALRSKAIDNLRRPDIQSISDLDRADHRAQYEAMKSILDEKGIPYTDTSSAQSKYLEVGGKKLRFADHPNMVKDSAVRGSLPIINVSPTEHKFSDALSHVEGIERNGQPTGQQPWDMESAKPVDVYGNLYKSIVEGGNKERLLRKESPDLWTPDNEELGVDETVNGIAYQKVEGQKYPQLKPEYADEYGDPNTKAYDNLVKSVREQLLAEWKDANHPNFSDVTDLHSATPNEQGTAFEHGLQHLGVKYRPEYSASTQSNYFYVDNPITEET
jgi:hypothetical protein